MSIDQVESFVVIAEEGAIVRAAKRLHISQPPLSRKIQALEEELGVCLFERRARGVLLTPEGQRFLGHANSILEAVALAKASVLSGLQGPQQSGSSPDSEPTARGCSLDLQE